MITYWPIHLSAKETDGHLLAKMGQWERKYAPKSKVERTDEQTD